MNIVFLDRDGTIIAEPSDCRVDTLEKIELFEDTIEALTYLADNNFSAIIITNQAGIAEGRITESQFWNINDQVLKLLEPSGIKILNTYFNPEADGPDASEWRKPGSKMLMQAAADFGIEISDVFMIGDSESDIQAAVGAGCKGGIFLKTSSHESKSHGAVLNAVSLLDAARYVVTQH